MNDFESSLFAKGYRLINGQWYPPNRLSPAAGNQPDPGNESVAADARTIANPVRRLVRVTSYRCRLVDRDGVWVKYLIDALKYAGIIFEDTTEWLQIEIEQKQVAEKRNERTEVEII